MVDRLRIDEDRLASIVSDLRGVASQPDPLDRVFEERTCPNYKSGADWGHPYYL